MARKPRKIDIEAEVEEQLPRPESAGQVADVQGLPTDAGADSQSVSELVEEGNFFEAAVVEGVENAPPADRSEVRTRQVPEDDVPLEYIDQERERPSDSD